MRFGRVSEKERVSRQRVGVDLERFVTIHVKTGKEQ
jgi:hypothetical protein